jgi:hypothetical protein
MKRFRSPLMLLALIFFGPLLLAIVLYAGRDSFNVFDAMPNPDRELIEDVLQMPPFTLEGPNGSVADAFQSRWSLIYARMPACDAACVDALERLSQIHQALGKERQRVRLVFLAPTAEPGPPAAAGFLAGRLDTREGAGLARLLGLARLAQGRYFVIDPLGNLILSYPADADQHRLLEDLERLLSVSRIG